MTLVQIIVLTITAMAACDSFSAKWSGLIMNNMICVKWSIALWLLGELVITTFIVTIAGLVGFPNGMTHPYFIGLAGLSIVASIVGFIWYYLFGNHSGDWDVEEWLYRRKRRKVESRP
jgi:low temperature requirement protein LtrA